MTDYHFILIKTIIDACLVSIILMVQLTVYPSFLYFTRENLLKWHQSYTKAITVIVGPLMTAQLLLSCFEVFGKTLDFFAVLKLVLVLAVWLSTAIQFVPIHNKIANNTHTAKDLKNLVRRNWLRVILWISILISSTANF